MPLLHLTSDVSASATGVGFIYEKKEGKLYLQLGDYSGEQAEAAAVGGEYLGVQRFITGEGIAEGEGSGLMTRLAGLVSTGAARASGAGFLSWAHPPRISPGLESRWRYGAGRTLSMLGTGSAQAGGEGDLT